MVQPVKLIPMIQASFTSTGSSLSFSSANVPRKGEESLSTTKYLAITQETKWSFRLLASAGPSLNYRCHLGSEPSKAKVSPLPLSPPSPTAVPLKSSKSELYREGDTERDLPPAGSISRSLDGTFI